MHMHKFTLKVTVKMNGRGMKLRIKKNKFTDDATTSAMSGKKNQTLKKENKIRCV